MATSYGSITIVDITDIGEFSVYPTANSPRTQIYSPDHTSGTGYTPDWQQTNLKITPVAYYASQNVSETATYEWKRRDGSGNIVDLTADETIINFPNTVHPGVLQVSNNVLGNSTSGIISYIVTAHYTVDNVSLEAVGEIDFALNRQGTVAKMASIVGENIFKYNSAGALTPSGKTITLEGKVAGVSIINWQYKNGNSWSTYPNSVAGSTTLTVNPEDNVFNNDSVTIRLNTSENSIYDLFTITKLKDGTKGDAVNSAVLSNEDQMLPADKNGRVTSYSGVETTLTIREGTQDVTSNWYITKTYSPTSLSELDSATNNYSANFTGTSTDSNVFNNIDTAYVLFECRKTSTGAVEFSRKFSLVKVKTGQDGASPVIYSLKTSALAVNTDPASDGVHPNPNPTSVTFNAYRQEGDNSPVLYDGRIQFYINDSSDITQAVTTDSSTRTINFSNSPWNGANVKSVKAVLYEAGSNTKQLDSQTIVIVNDGSQGQDGQPGATGPGAVNVIIGNEADIIPCDSDNHPIPNGTGADSDKFIIEIPFEGYQGITVKTTAVSAGAIPASDTGLSSAIVADTSTAGVVKYKIPNTATLVENGQVTLTFTVNTDDNNSVSVTKIYTWTRSSAAVSGQNAVALQVTTPNGTILVNGDGTLYAQGILMDGPEEATNETYTWAQFKNGTYSLIDSTTTGVETGHWDGTNWTPGTNGGTNTISDCIKITSNAVEGYASFRLVSIYKTKSYTQYISVIDKTDPVQVSLHSTIGTQIKNSQGRGCVYARVTRSGKELDVVPQNIEAGTSYPEGASNGEYFVLLSSEQDSTDRTAQLYKKVNGTWTHINSIAEEARTCNYEWTFRDVNNTPITTNVPYQNTSDKTRNQFIYVDANLINQKIIIDCKVEV